MTSTRSNRVSRFTRALLPILPNLRKTRARRFHPARPTSPARPSGETPRIEPRPEPRAAQARWGEDGRTALHLYLREVGQVDLLTPEEEAALARRVQAGDELAREQMIRANLRLVVKIAHEYEHLGLPLLDLINEGNIGLMKAVEKFDPEKGAKFSSYGSWWIKQSIRRAAANQAKTIRLPLNAVDQICHLRKAFAKLHEILGRDPQDAELAQEAGLSVRRVAELRDAAVCHASLDAPIGDDASATLADVLADENAPNPYQLSEGRNALSKVGELIDRLTPRESRIIRSRFGLGDGRVKTLDEIALEFSLTRERIRQLQNGVLTKLRRMLEEDVAPAR